MAGYRFRILAFNHLLRSTMSFFLAVCDLRFGANYGQAPRCGVLTPTSGALSMASMIEQSTSVRVPRGAHMPLGAVLLTISTVSCGQTGILTVRWYKLTTNTPTDHPDGVMRSSSTTVDWTEQTQHLGLLMRVSRSLDMAVSQTHDSEQYDTGAFQTLDLTLRH